MRDSHLRNLEQIHEAEGSGRGTRLGTLVLVSIGGAFLAFAAIALVRSPSNAAATPPDPLGELVAKANAKPPAAAKASDLPQDINFPSMLSDASRTTTALVAMRDEKGAKGTEPSTAAAGLPPGAPTAPPPATDRLPVVPLPAQNVAAASPIVTRPRDALTRMATEASATALEGMAEEGRPGGYQLQASSFRNETEAQAFANALRKRGHKAHVERADLGERGVWYRVRIGPFRSRAEARTYRAQFEQKEHLVPYLVEPGK